MKIPNDLTETMLVIPPEIDRDMSLTKQGKAFRAGLLKGYEKGYNDRKNEKLTSGEIK